MMPKYQNHATGELIDSPAFWAQVDKVRASGGKIAGGVDAYLFPDGQWWFPAELPAADRMEKIGAHHYWLWCEAHKRDLAVIPLLTDSELIMYRLSADIRADIPVLNAAAVELHRRGIRDYPIAV